MFFLEIFVIGVGLSMDAFTVAITKGILSINKRDSFLIAFLFGFFQFFMTFLGYSFGRCFMIYFASFKKYLSFFLLEYCGIHMILSHEEHSFNNLFLLSIATSIDALTVGIHFSMYFDTILVSSILIGIITFILSFIGYYIGYYFGSSFKNHSNYIGGLLLILFGFSSLF